MISITSISEFFYKLLNVTDLTVLLDGSIYRNQRPRNSQKSDIVIITRYLNGTSQQNINQGETQIIIILPKISGVPNLLKQKEIENKVLELLEKSRQFQETNNFYFDIQTTTEHDNFDGQNLFSSLYITTKIYKP